jgi:hypothetical protein
VGVAELARTVSELAYAQAANGSAAQEVLS